MKNPEKIITLMKSPKKNPVKKKKTMKTIKNRTKEIMKMNIEMKKKKKCL